MVLTRTQPTIRAGSAVGAGHPVRGTYLETLAGGAGGIHDRIERCWEFVRLPLLDPGAGETRFDAQPLDPWGSPYEYDRLDGTRSRLVRLGPDPRPGTGDGLERPGEARETSRQGSGFAQRNPM